VSAANFAAAAFFLYSYMFSGLFMAGTVGDLALVRFTSIFFYGWEALVANEFRKGKDANEPTACHSRLCQCFAKHAFILCRYKFSFQP
jgi:hypothetical protein